MITASQKAKAEYLGSLRFNSKTVYCLNFMGSLQQNSAVAEGSTELALAFLPRDNFNLKGNTKGLNLLHHHVQ